MAEPADPLENRAISSSGMSKDLLIILMREALNGDNMKEERVSKMSNHTV